MKKITKLVLPVAGLGKRLRPLTYKTPKALLKANGKPLLDYVLEETRGTEIEEAILVINPRQRKKFESYVKTARKKFPNLKFTVKDQKHPLGTGHVMLEAGNFTKHEPFAARFADDILVGEKPILSTLINYYHKTHSSILTLRKVPKSQVIRFGVAAVKKVSKQKGIFRILKIIEKPKLEEAPSNLVLLGAYILTPDILKEIIYLNKKNSGNLENDSQPITDAFHRALQKKKKIFGWEFKGEYLDSGTLELFRETERYLKERR